MVVHTAKQVIKMLESEGYTYLTHEDTGDHHFYKNLKTGVKITINYKHLKDEIKPGTYSAILRQMRGVYKKTK